MAFLRGGVGGILYLQRCTNSFNKYLTSITYIQGIVLETEDKSVNRIHKDPCRHGANILGWQRAISEIINLQIISDGGKYCRKT